MFLLQQWNRYGVVAYVTRRPFRQQSRHLTSITTGNRPKNVDDNVLTSSSRWIPRKKHYFQKVLALYSSASSSSSSSGNTSSSSQPKSERAQILNKHLESIGVDADELFVAAIKSLEDPTSGYDQKFGKSAIRAYRSFTFPKKNQKEESTTPENIVLSAAAGRCARQIDFLMKRHKSHQTEWVRHHDTIRDRRQVFPLVLILDNLRSAFNVGSLYRTADACGCELILTCGITPNPTTGNGSNKVTKSALGAELLVPSKHFATTLEAVQYLRNEMPTYKIIGLETTDNAESLYQFDFRSGETSIGEIKKEREEEELGQGGVALILGNEVTGVDTEIMSKIDTIVEIPTFGAKNSLNVASCAPVVLYEILRQWGKT